MEYNKIIAVTGMPGLYELLSSKADGAIVRSLEDKSTRFVASRSHNFSHLESIEVYTVRENVNLVDVLKAMEAGKEKLPDEKDAAALKAYFTKVYPDLDFDRVYSSDLKKMVKWFQVLKANNIEIKLTEPAEDEETAAPEAAGPSEAAGKEEKPAPEKKEETGVKAEKEPVKKAVKKPEEATAKAPEQEETAGKEGAGDEKPKAKKAAPKKKTEAEAEEPEAEKPKKSAKKKS